LKPLDRILRRWRSTIALSETPPDVRSAFDIGCADGYLLTRIPGEVRRDGCDPLASTSDSANGRILRGRFPDVVSRPGLYESGTYDAIYALAVFEHFDAVDLRRSSQVIADMLSDRGRLIATVPHPFVDRILHILMSLHLIDGQEVHEHHGFDPRALEAALPDLQLVRRRRFQLGLNHLFVFERAEPRRAIDGALER
jgi:hypothetical protein